MNPTQKLMMLVFFIICLTLAGCSDSETTVTAPPVDTAPPAVPTGLSTCTGDCVVKLTWDPNVVDSDLQGFNVYRLNTQQSWELTDTPITTSSFVDCSPISGQCTYRVPAVDFTGHESGWAQTVYSCWYPDEEMDRP